MFSRCFRDQIRVLRIENRVPRIREIGFLQVHTVYLTFSLKQHLEYVLFLNFLCLLFEDVNLQIRAFFA